MKKGTIIGLSILGVIVLWAIFSQRGLVSKEASVDESWANVQAAYQKRLNLVDNLVDIVKAEAKYESQTLKDIIAARSKAFEVKIDIDAKQLTEENMAKIQQAQSSLGSVMGRLAVLNEDYPVLQANESFKKLQDNIVEMENQVKVEMRKFNEAVKNYNVAVKSFPGNIMAGLLGYASRPMFKADEGASKAPKINMSE